MREKVTRARIGRPWNTKQRSLDLEYLLTIYRVGRKRKGTLKELALEGGLKE